MPAADANKELQRSVFHWAIKDEVKSSIDDEDEALEKRHATITAGEVAVKHGLPQEALTAWVSSEISAAESCQSLPFTLLLVVSYALMVVTHTRAPSVNAVEDSIGFDIEENANFAHASDFIGHKNINDVNSLTDFWSWMDWGFLPLIFVQQYQIAEGHNLTEPYAAQVMEVFPRQDRGLLLNYNRIVLGVRMAQERDEESVMADGQCNTPELQQLYDRDCVGGLGYELEPELAQARRTNKRSRELWLYIHDDQEEVRRLLHYLEDHDWLDTDTKKVELAIPVYNAEYGIHSMIMCDFFFSRGGHIWKNIIPLSSFSNSFSSMSGVIYDTVWFLCIVYIIVSEFREVAAVVKDYGLGGIWSQYMNPWNAVDWFSVFTGLGIMTMLYIHVTNQLSMNLQLEELGYLEEEGERLAYREKGKAYVDELEKEIHFFYTFKVMLGLYPLVIVIRLFKAFGSQPRLAVVTNTLHHASIDLAHFLIIFLSIFVTYLVAGVVLFGKRIDAFATSFRATITCFRLMFADFDWEELAEVGRVDAFLWFFPLVVLIMLLLLNMLIAIVMDAYSEVVSNLENKDTIWSMAKKAWKQKFNKDDLHLGIVLEKLKEERRLSMTRQAQAKRLARAGTAMTAASEGGDMAYATRFKMLLARTRSFGAATSIATSAPSVGGARSDASSTHADLDHIPFQQRSKHELNLITVGALKRMFHASEISRAQAKEIMVEAVIHFYHTHLDTARLDEIMVLINTIDYNSKKLKKQVKERVYAKGQAKLHPKEIWELIRHCSREIEEANEEVSEWLPYDEKDLPLTGDFLRPVPKREDSDEEDMHAHLHARQPLKMGLSRVVQHMSLARTRDESAVRNLKVGEAAQVLSDEHLVLSACRAAGIPPVFDDRRRAALGRIVEILDRDDKDGTVQVCLADEDAAPVWIATTAFAPKTAEIGIDADNPEALAQKHKELEADLENQRDEVLGKLHRCRHLHQEVKAARLAKQSALKKFHGVREHAVTLRNESNMYKDRLHDIHTKIVSASAERDILVAKVKSLTEENQILEKALAGKEWD